MIRTLYLTFSAFLILVLSGCTGGEDKYVIEVANPLDVKRANETIEVPKSMFSGMLCQEFERLAVKDLKSEKILVSQVIDKDMDGELDILVFQPELDPGETRMFELVPQDEPVKYPDVESRTFSRFVPERTDDYAWENDRVAFRTYGPTAQKMVEDKIKGGTLSSGIDCWLKRVDYPIIDKWYREHLEEGKSYHKDTGEGLDDFHVGPSRGCGGIGIWVEEENKYYTSRNFSEWLTITEGPVRTLFELKYQPWEGPAGMVSEKKTISLDLGSNLMRVEIELKSDEQVGKFTAGITLHEKDGTILADKEAGWFSYWQPHGDSELGMGIVVELEYLSGYSEYISDGKDESHLLVHLKPVNGRVVYYAGFGWKNSGRFVTEESWTDYLAQYATRLGSRLIVSSE